ncbi:D-alanine--D-alanine ligase [Carnobacteriaceae bacterium zg-ZUI252]|nr:D-alanine--D-alanine ligase [Carnobacteriaceae bacterium zg-ZUI252]MBS4769821.1 D-alanine--D-alanine ligase [Carnobacteriaceae bacterium zg-ZUI240]
MKKLFLIYGGKSQEHDISILTALNISKALDYQLYEVHPIYIAKNGVWHALNRLECGAQSEQELTAISQHSEVLPTVIKQDNAIVFPVLHGPNGEDGTIQGLFEMLDVPYVGTGVMASACGMDKIISKKIFEKAGIPQLAYVEVYKKAWEDDAQSLIQKCENELTYPMFVKPANMGSSVGISKAENVSELENAIRVALRYDRRVVVETGVVARELEVAMLGNDDAKASVVGEVLKVVDFYDFEEKYKNGNAQLQIPAKIDETISRQIRDYAVTAYKALDGSGLSRVDFFLTENNDIYINEINTLPGFTQFSMYPLLWEATGIAYADLITELLRLAQERYDEKKLYQQVN